MSVPRPGVPELPEVRGDLRDRRGCGRWATVGCLALVVVLTAVLLGSFLFLDRGVRWVTVRARQKLERNLPSGVDGAARRAFEEDMDRFFARIGEDPAEANRLSGEFIQRVGAALEDGRVTLEEMGSIQAFLRTAAPPEEEPGERP